MVNEKAPRHWESEGLEFDRANGTVRVVQKRRSLIGPTNVPVKPAPTKGNNMHFFDPDIASRVGLNAAVIYQNIVYWTEKNAANGRHFHDGKYWTYNSNKAMETLFPYLSSRQIRTAIDKLKDCGLLDVGNFNQSTYDRTLWYCPVSQLHLSEKANGVGRKVQPIPDMKPDMKPVVKQERRASAHVQGDLLDADISKPEESKPKTIKARLPEEWTPNEKNVTDAVAIGFLETEIGDFANEFRDYWCDRNDKGSRKTARGWDATWANRCRDRVGVYQRNRRMAGQAQSNGYGRGSDIASIAAQRRIDGKV